MQSSSSNPYSQPSMMGAPSAVKSSESMASLSDSSQPEAVLFEGRYAGQMEMSADRETVAQYLDVHQEWFRRCAEPMQVEAIGTNGYALLIGHFGALGHEVEPKVGLLLLPQQQGVYRIETIAIPDYTPPGYDVDFRASLELNQDSNDSEAVLTHVDWELHLTVGIQLPRFIHALPKSLVKASGDRLLNQIVRQVSKRLTRKVQEDFHQVQNLPLPASYDRHRFWTGWNRDDEA
ncbi:hypothetical protein C7271_02560 [filamentous cyanobacterium CCP5]|nr:hypothetical protein C7271_02560 [filamentous cyanobacterium CCP5]